MNTKSTSTNKKKVNPIKDFIKVTVEIIIVAVIGIFMGTLWIAADMKEHPSLSGVNPEKSVVEIAVEDVLSA